jgi:hypothetical protein
MHHKLCFWNMMHEGHLKELWGRHLEWDAELSRSHFWNEQILRKPYWTPYNELVGKRTNSTTTGHKLSIRPRIWHLPHNWRMYKKKLWAQVWNIAHLNKWFYLELLNSTARPSSEEYFQDTRRWECHPEKWDKEIAKDHDLHHSWIRELILAHGYDNEGRSEELIKVLMVFLRVDISYVSWVC